MITKSLPCLTLLFTCLLTACANTAGKKPQFTGNYTLETSSEKAFDAEGKLCPNASGELTITDNAIRGTVISSQGFSLDILGKTASDGDAKGSFAIGENVLATFTGTFTRSTGYGQWQDTSECSGTWTAIGRTDY